MYYFFLQYVIDTLAPNTEVVIVHAAGFPDQLGFPDLSLSDKCDSLSQMLVKQIRVFPINMLTPKTSHRSFSQQV